MEIMWVNWKDVYQDGFSGTFLDGGEKKPEIFRPGYRKKKVPLRNKKF